MLSPGSGTVPERVFVGSRFRLPGVTKDPG